MRGVVVAVCGVVVVVRGIVGVGRRSLCRRSLCRRSLCAGPSYSPWRVTASRVRTRRTHERRALVAAPRSTRRRHRIALIVAAPRLLIARTHPRVPSWTFAWDFVIWASCGSHLPSSPPPPIAVLRRAPLPLPCAPSSATAVFRRAPLPSPCAPSTATAVFRRARPLRRTSSPSSPLASASILPPPTTVHPRFGRLRFSDHIHLSLSSCCIYLRDVPIQLSFFLHLGTVCSFF